MEEKMKSKQNRVMGGILYLVFGAILLLILIFKINLLLALKELIFLFSQSSVAWCIAWTSIGIGAGLINTRDLPYGNWWLHILGYYGFILLSVSLLSFVVAVYYSNNGWTEPHMKFYSLAALIGLVGGFLGDIFRPIALSLLALLNKVKQ